jgi:hypothetical protein
VIAALMSRYLPADSNQLALLGRGRFVSPGCACRRP